MVGDFSEEDIESCILDYLGTVRPTKGFERAQQYSPILFSTAPFGLQHQQVRKDCFSSYVFLCLSLDDHIGSWWWFLVVYVKISMLKISILL